MGSSDFDAHTFAQHSSFAIGVKAHCPLNQNLRQWKRRAHRPQQRSSDVLWVLQLFHALIEAVSDSRVEAVWVFLRMADQFFDRQT
jgi:hypothetical protein